MFCPFCGNDDTRVVDSRLASEGDQVRRRRECLSCKERFTTYEYAVFNMPLVTKSSGERQSFDEHKLRAGMMRATQKRPVEVKAIDAAIIRIQKNILNTGNSEIESSLIGEFVMDELRAMDDVAYIRFASVYRDFNDINEFIEAIEGLENTPSPELKRRQIKLPGAD